jgi:hypothetical protein
MMDIYTCANCGINYPRMYTDAEIEIEAESVFGPKPLDLPAEELLLVCEPCYNQIILWARENHFPLTWVEPDDS